MPTIAHNGVETRYAEAGSGPAILLIHGAEADGGMFSRLVPLLAPRLRCIAYDQRDSGGTANPADPYGLERLADDAAGLIAALGLGSAHVFGTSLGSVVAQHLAVRHPRRVDRLVLSSAIRAGRVLEDFAAATVAELAPLRRDPVANAGAIARFFFPDAFLASNPSVWGSLASARTPEQRARRAPLLARRHALDLGRIAAPTLVLAGLEDRLIPPSHTLAIADEIRGAERCGLPGTGHVGAVQDPRAVADAVLGFLAGNGTAIREDR